MIAPGDVVVLPGVYGIGSLGQPLFEPGMGRSGADLWERVFEAAGKPTAIRLNRAVLALRLVCPPLEELICLAEEPEPDRDEIVEAIDAVLAYDEPDEGAAPAPPEWWRDLLHKVRSGRMEEHPAGGLVIFRRGSAGRRLNSEQDLFADDDDLTSAAGREISLDEHSDLVKRTAARVARFCVPEEYVPVVELAADWHDAGKLDERFQMLLHQGDELAAVTAPAPLAKSASIPSSPRRRRQIRQASGLPSEFRHEMLSVQLAAQFSRLPEGAAAADLALHLIASHHGHGRPFAPVSPDDSLVAVVGERAGTAFTLNTEKRASLPPPHRLDSGIADRFWRLVRRHGWWGLAYLEAIFRLSDWYASEFTASENGAQQRESVA